MTQDNSLPIPDPNTDPERLTGRAMRRGAAGRCPRCGEGRLFASFLKVRDHCPTCGEAMHHQRADDGPAYLTVLIVSHLCAPVLLWVFVAWRPSVAVMLAIFGTGAIVASLAMLPRIKGAMVGLQWARRMHGFGHDAGNDADHDTAPGNEPGSKTARA